MQPRSNGPESADALAGADAEVLAILVGEHRRFLAFLEGRLGDRATAEEVLQQAFVRALESGASLRRSESAVAWFFRLLRNAVVDHHRRGGRGPRVAEDLDPEHEPAAPDGDTQAAICACVGVLAGTLKPEYATALKRVELDGLSLQAFAAEAGITANNAAVRLFRAREALEKRLRATCRTCADHGCLDCSCGAGPRPGAHDPV